ncbi:hypothetical protein C6502_07350 [Candidatus Poribacteria bacterium]|nr:MAG: hypothetical protein C6502_07350 [Candidatus Poribacteria bacterium]
MKVRRFTIFRLLSLFVALIVGFCACDQTGQLFLPGTFETEAPANEIPVGVVLSVTGRFAASSGVSIGHGLDLALEEINRSQRNGRQIRFIIADDESTVAGAVEAYNKLIQDWFIYEITSLVTEVEAYNKLIQDGIPVILGPATSSQTEAAFPVAQEHGVVAMSPTSTARGLSALGDYLFRAALTTDVVIPSGIETTHAKLGYQTAATMYDDTDVFSTDSDLAVRETLATKGVEVLITETFRGGDTDFTAQLTRINEMNPDVIFVSAQAPEKPGILTQGRQVGIPVSVPFIVRTLTTANVQAAGTAAEGAITFVGWASTANTPGNQVFVQNYTEKYGEAPDNYAARAYVALSVLAEAIANAPSINSTAIRDALANITDFDTVAGKFSFNTVGDAVYEPKILIVKDGELQIFE